MTHSHFLIFCSQRMRYFFFLLNIKVLYDKRDSAYRKSKLLVRALNVTDIVFSTFARSRLYRS